MAQLCVEAEQDPQPTASAKAELRAETCSAHLGSWEEEREQRAAQAEEQKGSDSCRTSLVNPILPSPSRPQLPTASRWARSRGGAHESSQRCHTCHPTPCQPPVHHRTSTSHPGGPGQGQTLLLVFSCSYSNGKKGYREI